MIDEIDKADTDFQDYMLDVLDQMEFDIIEIDKTIRTLNPKRWQKATSLFWAFCLRKARIMRRPWRLPAAAASFSTAILKPRVPQSGPSSDLSDISQDFRPSDILGILQAIKGFDKSDFYVYFYGYHAALQDKLSGHRMIFGSFNID